MIGQRAGGAAPIGHSAAEELVEAALTGAVAVLLWTGLRRLAGAAVPLLWRRAQHLLTARWLADCPAESAASPPPATLAAAMCSLAGPRSEDGLCPAEGDGAVSVCGGEATSGDSGANGVAAFGPADASYGDGVVIASDDGCENVDSAVCAGSGVTMSDVTADHLGDPASVDGVAVHAGDGDVAGGATRDTSGGDDGVVAESADDNASGGSDEENPCNRTFYCNDDDGDDGDNDDDDDDEYDDWFAVANDDEIRTIATADLQPFYGDLGGEPGRRPGSGAVFDLAAELDTDPEFVDGYSCLETIVEENSDDMRSDAESLRSGPASWGWSGGSEEPGSPAALAPGPPGWTWCLEPSDSTGGADDWGSEEECEPTARVRRASAGDELLESSSLRHSRELDWGEPITKSCVGAPLFSGLPPVRPLAATATAAWRHSPELLSQAAPPSPGDFRGRHWCVDNEPISAELCDPNVRRHSDPGAVCGGGAVDLPAASPRPSSAAGDPAVATGRPGSPDGAAPTPRAPPPPQAAGRGSDAPTAAHHRAAKVLGAPRNGQLGVSVAERITISARPGGGAAAGATGGATVPADADPRGAAGADSKWDLGSCEDFENLDRRIESLTFDFEEEERRTLQALECLESLDAASDQQRRLYQRLLADQEAVPGTDQRRDAVRRFHSSGDLTMISSDVTQRGGRPVARSDAANPEGAVTDADVSAQTRLSGAETAVPRLHARVELLRHSSENLSEDSGFGEQPAGARSSSEASSPPPSLSLSTPREEAARQAEAAPSRLGRRSQSTPDLSPSVQRRRRLLELIGRDERRRARVYVDAVASDARDAAPLGASEDRPALPQPQEGQTKTALDLGVRLDVPAPPSAGKERPVPAPRTLLARPAAVYQNVPPNAWLAAQAGAGAGGKETFRQNTQVNGSSSPAFGPREFPQETGTCSVYRDEVAARPDPATRGFARPTPDCPLDNDDGASDDSVMVCVATRRFKPELDGQAERGDTELTSSDDRWQAMSEYAMPRAHSLTPTHDAYVNEPRDIYLTDDKAQPSLIHRRAAGRPKPLDIASAQEFLLLEGAAGERFAADAFEFSPDAAVGARHIRPAGPAEGAAGAAAGAGAADRPIAAPAAAGPVAPGNRRWHSQWDLSTVVAADGRGARSSAARSFGGSVQNLSTSEDMAAPRQAEPRGWTLSAPTASAAAAAPHLTRLNGHGLGCPDWLDTSMEPDSGETSPVGGFFSRVAVSAAPPDAASLPGLLRRAGHSDLVSDGGRDGSRAGAVRRYGPQSGVEVRINRQDARPPPAAASRAKGVQFSPLVSEVHWREIYLDEEPAGRRTSSPAWDERDEPGAPPRPPLPTQHADRRATVSPPPPPPRTKSLPAAARLASAPPETQRLRVSYPVDSGDGGGVRRQVVTCERAGDASLLPAGGAEMERRRNGGSAPSAAPAAAPRPAPAAEKPRTMLERLGLTRLSGGKSRPRPTGGSERIRVASRSPSPGAVSSVVVREAEIVSPRAEVVSVPPFDAGSRDVVTSTPLAAVRTASPPAAAWDVYSRESSVETVLSAQLTDRLLSGVNPSSEPPAPLEEPPAAKPPLPPRITQSQVTRARLSSARHQFLGTLSGSPVGPAPRAVPPPPIPDAAPAGGTATEVRDAFERFRQQAREDRERLAQSTPDLSLIETTTRGLVRSPSPARRAAADESPPHQEARLDASRHDSGYEIDWGTATSTVRAASGGAAARGRAGSAGSWPATPPQPQPQPQPQAPLPCQETDLDAIVRGLQQFIDEISPRREKAKSLLNLEEGGEQLSRTAVADSRAKSMEFLLDDENKATTLPPENELMRGGEAARQLSRHELRFQRSLRNLNTPEWYRKAARPAPTPRRTNDAGSLAGGWSGLSSKSSSKESLPLTVASAAAAPTPLPRRGDWRSFRAARETASVPGTAAASPVPLCRRGSAGSARRAGPAAGPAASATSPGLRRPYLGWRSQERLGGQGYQTPVERLASSFRGTPGVRRPAGARGPPASSDGAAGLTRAPPAADDVRTSIREVTDAIVHYFDPAVHGQNGCEDYPSPRKSPAARSSRETSPSKQRALWLETAFVGARPVDGSAEPLKGGSTVGSPSVPASAEARQERFELGEFLAV